MQSIATQPNNEARTMELPPDLVDVVNDIDREALRNEATARGLGESQFILYQQHLHRSRTPLVFIIPGNTCGQPESPSGEPLRGPW